MLVSNPYSQSCGEANLIVNEDGSQEGDTQQQRQCPVCGKRCFLSETMTDLQLCGFVTAEPGIRVNLPLVLDCDGHVQIVI